MSRKESATLTNAIIGHVFATGGFAWRASSTGIYDQSRARYRTAAKTGVSDVLAIYEGCILAIEVKVGADRLRDEQVGFLKNVEHYGGRTFVAKDLPSFIYWWSAACEGILNKKNENERKSKKAEG